jgi:hypothetical protein
MNNENVMSAAIDEVDELYHYGVPGMKWGVRRTPAQLGHNPPSKKRMKGAKKYIESLVKQHKNNRKVEKEAKKIDKAAKKAEAEERKKNAASKKKSIEEMSDDELAKYIGRKNAEKLALSIERDINTLKPEKVSAGKKLAAALGDRAVGALAGAGERLMKEAMNKAIEKALGNGASEPFAELAKEAKKAGYDSVIAKARKDIADAEKSEIQTQRAKKQYEKDFSDNSSSEDSSGSASGGSKSTRLSMTPLSERSSDHLAGKNIRLSRDSVNNSSIKNQPISDVTSSAERGKSWVEDNYADWMNDRWEV